MKIAISVAKGGGEVLDECHRCEMVPERCEIEGEFVMVAGAATHRER